MSLVGMPYASTVRLRSHLHARSCLRCAPPGQAGQQFHLLLGPTVPHTIAQAVPGVQVANAATRRVVAYGRSARHAQHTPDAPDDVTTWHARARAPLLLWPLPCGRSVSAQHRQVCPALHRGDPTASHDNVPAGVAFTPRGTEPARALSEASAVLPVCAPS
jgi:hypothetical protein